MPPLHPLQVRDVRFDVGKILRLMVKMAKRDLHAAELVLKDRRTAGVRAGVVLGGRPGLLHAGRMVQPLGLTVAIAGSLTCVHAVLPTPLHGVASHAHVGHLVHVWHAVVHHVEPRWGTIKTKLPQLTVLKAGQPA